jgi:hypothetical protein
MGLAPETGRGGDLRSEAVRGRETRAQLGSGFGSFDRLNAGELSPRTTGGRVACHSPRRVRIELFRRNADE